ncbi:MAG: Rne/Rng family ribonuclease [Polyangiaceae bacterium]|nr:Rne/Rng family ribonuclease [Polyangiaceae bacterium]MCW5790315.1 Rne/Rng family ribonuclease [Polyangiaceae bacterium]
MARNLLVINVALRETRVALIEDGVIAELQIERARARNTVGNIILGKVTRVLPGMQAAFIDVGMDRAAFLHVEDLIRPHDFEDYLAGAAQSVERKSDLESDTDDEGAEAGPVAASDAGAGSDRGVGSARAAQSRDAGDAVALSDAVSDPDDVPIASSEDEDDDVEVISPALDSDEDDTSDDDEDDASDEDDDESDDDDESEDDDESDDADDDDESDDADDDDDADDADDDDESDDAEDTDDESDDDDDESDDDESDDTDDDDESDDDESDDADDDDESDDDADDDDGVEATHASRDDDADGADDDPADDTDDVEIISATADGSETPAAEGEPTRVRVRRRVDPLPEEPEAGEEASSEEAGASAEGGDGRRRRRRRGRRRRGNEAAQQPAAVATPQPEAPKESGRRSAEERRGRDKRQRRGSKQAEARTETPKRGATPARVSRSVPITEVVREGDEVVVQISKEPIGTKGARVTSHVSLPGRHVVYLPTVEHIGISKRIGSFHERQRLRKAIESVKPPTGGLIVRTVAEGLTKKHLKEDIGYLLKLWADVAKRRESARAPTVLYEELDLVLKVVRDLFTDEIEKIVIDDKEQYARIIRFAEMFMPTRVKDIELYTGEDPIFDAYGIEDEIARALSRKVPLPSGGYLILDQAEALTAIDVNTGRYVGKGSKDLEETALKTNLEAVDEIAYQLRFRNIGGLVILDLIDMENAKNRDKVWRALEQRLERDKAKTTLNRISELGLIEMTRKRTRESLGRTMHEPCFYCDGTGQIMSRTTIAYEILRQVRRELHQLPGYSVHVNAHPAVVDLLKTEERDAVVEAERRYMRRIEFTARREYHIEQFDLEGK